MAVCLVALFLEGQQRRDVVLIANTGAVYLTADAQHGCEVGSSNFSDRAGTLPRV